MEIRYSKAAVKAINGMDKATKARIRAGILGLTQNHLWAILSPYKATTMGDTVSGLESTG